MDFRIVYRSLRKISDWILVGFYSEVYVEGYEDVPKNAPLIIASTHHNDSIDVATLSVTIPHRRHVSFWAKSTLFNIPVLGAILSSSGSIPVKRNPNKLTESGTPNSSNGNGSIAVVASIQTNLFQESSIAMARGQVLGVFVEGASYTGPNIMQVLPGAARAALEFAKWERHTHPDGTQLKNTRGHLVIVPVGITYTDKSQYRSRLLVRLAEYGTPIAIESYSEELFSVDGLGPEEISRVVVKKVMNRVEEQLVQLTINAPDWNTLRAARLARDILWEGRQIPLEHFVQITQTLVHVLSNCKESCTPQSQGIINNLLNYFSLLHYTGISHIFLEAAYSYSFTSPQSRTYPSIPYILYTTTKQLMETVLHPRFILFIPPFIVHIPSYILGTLAAWLLAPANEEEGQAQFKAMFGGLGSGVGYGMMTWIVYRWFYRQGGDTFEGWPWVGKGVLGVLRDWNSILSGNLGCARRVGGIFALAYGLGWLFAKWHNILIDGNYTQCKRLMTSFKLLVGLVSPRSSDVPSSQLAAYSRVPEPFLNPFVKRKDKNLGPAIPTGPAPPASYRQLIRPLLDARLEAKLSLRKLMADPSVSREHVDFLSRHGAQIP